MRNGKTKVLSGLSKSLYMQMGQEELKQNSSIVIILLVTSKYTQMTGGEGDFLEDYVEPYIGNCTNLKFI